MPLPVSANQAKRLGDRLANADQISPKDDALLNDFLVSYDAPMERAAVIVRGLGHEATTRLKTRGTLIEKLRRDPNTKLPSIQDVAGLRLTVRNRVHQDETVTQVVSALEAEGCAVKVIDRRENPSSGYRAVHLVAKVDGVPVEAQIRTVLQDLWAQVSERMGDRYGRSIRYGGDPHPTGDSVEDQRRLNIVTRHRDSLSAVIHQLEQRYAELLRRQAENNRSEASISALNEQLAHLVDTGSIDANQRSTIEGEIEKLALQIAKNKISISEAIAGVASVAVTTKDALQSQIDRLSSEGEEA